VGVKVLVKLTLQEGRRGEFVQQYEALSREHETSMRAAGWLGSTMFGAVGAPETVIEIAEWESAEAREAVLNSSLMEGFAPLFEMMAAPFEATVLEQL
jgi:quinol monooxygenase YgiN